MRELELPQEEIQSYIQRYYAPPKVRNLLIEERLERQQVAETILLLKESRKLDREGTHFLDRDKIMR